MTASVASTELESVEYHRESESYRAQYDRDETSASMAVVAALSDVMDSDPTELEPLHASIDTGALNEVVSLQDATNGDISVTFTVAEYAITVYSYGVVAIDPPGHNRIDDLNEGAPHT
ncbi:HalOD1 output domain-containing protein [Natronorubrum sp. FCH18a]|uniref:HalOD1 output domain-containing protein n=1 Tax=Natronorubrum sp. FCH18a TaxID=3447018 RepID=UPI003F515CFA